ncbi:hypothetical protein [Paramicrobacterium agarici]|uniref:hypothetical protein n=1 Tax=Paramicrobacterium agarici TaxID=630514 RepID=UPI00114F301E|nr:hypothetical protein [Microbacterium agarici]TQO24163.1 hypothetical protein FB385_3039 [Microbacterium agarici]
MTQPAGQHDTDPSEGDVYFWELISKDDVAAYLAFITERYPRLRDVLDRVADELVEEGVDLQRLSAGDLSAFNDQLPNNTSGD